MFVFLCQINSPFQHFDAGDNDDEPHQISAVAAVKMRKPMLRNEARWCWWCHRYCNSTPVAQLHIAHCSAQVPVPVAQTGTGVTTTAIQHRCFLSFSTYDTVQLFELITSLCKFLNRLGSLQPLSLQQHQYIFANLIGFSTYHKTPKCDKWQDEPIHDSNPHFTVSLGSG